MKTTDKSFTQTKIYAASTRHLDGRRVMMADGGFADILVAHKDLGFLGGEPTCSPDELCYSLTHENARRLRALFPYTAPAPVLKQARTLGTGDRLGIATPGHIRAFENYDALPVLAQQSIRELKLTGRSYEQVLDDVTFAVFRAGFERGFGADGDHLKTDGEIEYALSCGYTMITLDCSEYIKNDAAAMSDAEIEAVCPLDQAMEERYCGRTFILEDSPLSFTRSALMRAAFIYGEALDRIADVYRRYIRERQADFEISIDETTTPTSPQQHYFIASELKRRGVRHETLAPRFCGDFEKGVDYRGDIRQFGRELHVHAAIARQFGYKLSIHSGSDKFSAFSCIGQETRGNFHVKTAGTSWLEAMKVVAETNPEFYREMHIYALSVFGQAAKYYHVSADLDRIPSLSSLADQALVDLFSQEDARQLVHITYGLILNASDDAGKYRFRERLFGLWRENREIYARKLENHIGKHLELLYAKTAGKDTNHE